MQKVEDWPPLPPPPVGYDLSSKAETKADAGDAGKKKIAPPPAAPGKGKERMIGGVKARVVRNRFIKPPPAGPKRAVAKEIRQRPPGLGLQKHHESRALIKKGERTEAKDVPAGTENKQANTATEPKKQFAPPAKEVATKAAEIKSHRGHSRNISIPPPPPPPLTADVIEQDLSGAGTRRKPKIQDEIPAIPEEDLPPPPPPASTIESIPPPPEEKEDEHSFSATPHHHVSIRSRHSHARHVSKQFDAPSLTSVLSSESIEAPPPPPEEEEEVKELPPPPSPEKPAVDGKKSVPIVTDAMICDQCRRHITGGLVIQAVGKAWHPEHFICQGSCQRSLKDQNYYVYSDSVFCQKCYTFQFSPPCGRCGHPVLNGVGNDDIVYHPKCLKCSVCERQCTDEMLESGDLPFFFNAKGEVFCDNDFTKAKTNVSTCAAPTCGKAIEGQSALLLGKEYHPDCVKCTEPGCGKLLGRQDDDGNKSHVYVHEASGQFYCKDHLQQQAIANCDRCQQPISRGHSGVKVKSHLFHQECMTCKECNKPLYKGSSVFLSKGDVPIFAYCKEHAHLVSTPSPTKSPANQQKKQQPRTPSHKRTASSSFVPGCAVCGGSLAGHGVILALGARKYHQKCVVCKVCKHDFPGGKGIYKDPKDGNSFMCKQHYIESTASRCVKCNEFITSGKMVTAGTETYHADCFEGDVTLTKATPQVQA